MEEIEYCEVGRYAKSLAGARRGEAGAATSISRSSRSPQGSLSNRGIRRRDGEGAERNGWGVPDRLPDVLAMSAVLGRLLPDLDRVEALEKEGTGEAKGEDNVTMVRCSSCSSWAIAIMSPSRPELLDVTESRLFRALFFGVDLSAECSAGAFELGDEPL